MARPTAVLLVEDDVDVAEVVRELLEGEGMAVLAARDGRQALSALERFAPDVIVTDLMMPVMDGFAFLRAYAQRPPPHVPVVVTSAFPAYVEAAQSLGCAATLRKPFEFDELLETIRAVSGAPAGQEAEAPPPVSRGAPPNGADETHRLRAIAAWKLDIPAPDKALRELAHWVARLFDVPVCAVSVVGDENQRFAEMYCALDSIRPDSVTPRRHAFCTHAVVARAALVVQDTLENPLFQKNPVVHSAHIRFYAGMPLMTRFGHAIGTLCLMDNHPRDFGVFDLELLGLLSRRVLAELEQRQRRSTDEPRSAFRSLSMLDEELGVLSREAFADAAEVLACRSAELDEPLALAAVEVRGSSLPEAVEALSQEFPAVIMGRLGGSRVGVLAPGLDAQVLWQRLTERSPKSQVSAVDVAPFPAVAVEGLKNAEAALQT